jgi:hypothetical protein
MEPMWEPLWKAVYDVQLPLHFHMFPTTSPRVREMASGHIRRAAQFTGVAGFQMNLINIIAAIIGAGVLERYPNLRIGLGESGIGWLPYALDRMDFEYEDRFRDLMKLKPSEYQRRQCRATFQFDRIGAKLVEDIGVETLMSGSDYPHPAIARSRAQDYLRKRRQVLRSDQLTLAPSICRSNLGERPVALKQRAPRSPVESDIAQNAIAIALDLDGEVAARASAADPGIHIAGTPVVRRNRFRPIAVAAVQAREIRATQLPVLGNVEPVTAAEILRRRGRDLHRPLGSVRLGPPHPQIGPVAGFGTVDRKSDAIEIGLFRWTEQLDDGRRQRYRAPEHRHRSIARVSEHNQFGLYAIRGLGLQQRCRPAALAPQYSDGLALRVVERDNLGGLGRFRWCYPNLRAFRR